MPTVTRRGFVTSLVGSGLALRLSWTPAALAAPPAPTALNPWITVKTDGTVLVTIARSEMGQGIETGIAMLVAEELEADWSTVTTRWAPWDAVYGSQRTSASDSMRSMWQPMREVAATAREMLRRAAAEQWKTPLEACTCSNGWVLHSDGRRLSYGSLAVAASRQSLPATAPLKSPGDFRIIGQRLKRLNTRAVVTGERVYGPDVEVPGMLTASIERCPYLGGRLVSFDASAVLREPGVETVVAVDDLLDVPRAVAVVGTDFWTVNRARRLLKIKWARGEPIDSAGLSTRLKRAAAGSAAEQVVNRGDVARPPPGSALISATYQVPLLAHVPMSPMCCTAHVTADHAEAWVPTQGVRSAANVLAMATGLPLSALAIHKTYLGGAFGRRQHHDYLVEAARVSRAVARPVKVMWTREDDIRHDFFRPASLDQLSATLGPDGLPSYWYHRIASLAGTVLCSVGSDTTPYAVPNKRVELSVVPTQVPVGPWRGVAHSQMAFVVESFVDELAGAAGVDPYSYRRRLLQGSPRHQAVLDATARASNWAKLAPAGHHRGIALHETEGSIVATVAEVSVRDGALRVHQLTSCIDCGLVINPALVEAQLEGAATDGLTTALQSEVTLADGQVEQSNFHNYPLMRMRDVPRIQVQIMPSGEPPSGAGEAGLPPVAPAVANALARALGRRSRRLPLRIGVASD